MARFMQPLGFSPSCSPQEGKGGVAIGFSPLRVLSPTKGTKKGAHSLRPIPQCRCIAPGLACRRWDDDHCPACTPPPSEQYITPTLSSQYKPTAVEAPGADLALVSAKPDTIRRGWALLSAATDTPDSY